MNHQTLVVLDFGSQFTQLIARRLRELSVYSEILPFDTPIAEIARAEARSGSSCPAARRACRKPARRTAMPAVFDAGVPVLGICYGMQLMTHALGGEVAPAPHREFGHGDDHGSTPSAPLFAVGARRAARVGEPRRLRQDRAARLSRSTATSAERAGRGDGGRRIARLYALLFHPEVAHTDHGLDILRNFAYDVCGCTGDWTMASFVRGGDGTDPRAGRGRAGRLRPERRRRLDRRGAADSPGDRRSADVHLRRQRRDAAGRGGADSQRGSSG